MSIPRNQSASCTKIQNKIVGIDVKPIQALQLCFLLPVSYFLPLILFLHFLLSDIKFDEY